MKIDSWGFMMFSWTILGFYCSWSEAQKGAEDRGQIKALLGGLPVTIVSTLMMVELMSKPLPFGIPSVLVILPTLQPRQPGHVPLLVSTQCESIFLKLSAGNTLEWYLEISGSITMTIGKGNSNSGYTMFNTIRIAPGYTTAESHLCVVCL